MLHRLSGTGNLFSSLKSAEIDSFLNCSLSLTTYQIVHNIFS